MSKNKVDAWASRPGGDDVCICGVGARTAVGLSAEASAAAVRGSISGLALHPFFVDQDDEVVSFAGDPMMDPNLPITERMLTMLQSVTEEATGQATAITPIKIDRCWLALPEPRRGLNANFGDVLVGMLTKFLDLSWDEVFMVPDGHASGLMALQAAAKALSNNEVETAQVVGVDSYHDIGTIESLDARRALMAERNPSGFPPGEGAGACLLVRRSTAEQYGLPVLAHVRSAATAIEPHPIRSTQPCLGEGLTAVIASVISSLKLPTEQITASYCDLNGERYRNEEFVYALLRTQEGFVDAHDFVSPADCWGDVGAASGPLFAVLAVASRLRGYAKGRHPMLWAGSNRGYRAAITLDLGNN